MANLKEVIRGLECCKSRSTCNDECPYYHIMENPNFGMDDCTSMLASDALSLLKAQKPSVMMVEEVETWIETDTLERDPIYFEKRGLEFGEWIDPFEDFCDADIVGYGLHVRCWTSRPTDEQRKAVKWDE